MDHILATISTIARAAIVVAFVAAPFALLAQQSVYEQPMLNGNNYALTATTTPQDVKNAPGNLFTFAEYTCMNTSTKPIYTCITNTTGNDAGPVACSSVNSFPICSDGAVCPSWWIRRRSAHFWYVVASTTQGFICEAGSVK